MELNAIAAKRSKRLMTYLKREYGKNKDFTITIETKSATQAIIKLTYARFLDTASRNEYDTMANELLGVCSDHGEAVDVQEGDSYFGGDLASLLIKPGKTIHCDSLMSHIEVMLKYPMSSK
jgi:hypothetical protein